MKRHSAWCSTYAPFLKDYFKEKELLDSLQVHLLVDSSNQTEETNNLFESFTSNWKKKIKVKLKWWFDESTRQAILNENLIGFLVGSEEDFACTIDSNGIFNLQVSKELYQSLGLIGVPLILKNKKKKKKKKSKNRRMKTGDDETYLITADLKPSSIFKIGTAEFDRFIWSFDEFLNEEFEFIIISKQNNIPSSLMGGMNEILFDELPNKISSKPIHQWTEIDYSSIQNLTSSTTNFKIEKKLKDHTTNSLVEYFQLLSIPGNEVFIDADPYITNYSLPGQEFFESTKGNDTILKTISLYKSDTYFHPKLLKNFLATLERRLTFYAISISRATRLDSHGASRSTFGLIKLNEENFIPWKVSAY